MAVFQVQKKVDGDLVHFEFSGSLDEDAKLPVITEKIREVHIDLRQLKTINSCGIREWVKWIQPLSQTYEVHFHCCPKIVIDQVNMVSGFLPKNVYVESFYVPYYCEENDADRSILLERERDFRQPMGSNPGFVNFQETMTFDDVGGEYEIDVISAKYFKFLKVS